MGTLEKVMQMRQQGASDSQIIDNLKQGGISPKEINDALSQSQVKTALNNEQNYQQENMAAINSQPQGNMPRQEGIAPVTTDISQQQSKMMPSMMESEKYSQTPLQPPANNFNQQAAQTPNYSPISEQAPPQEMPQYQETAQNYQEMPQYQEIDPNYSYPEYQYSESPQGDTETISEIAEQIIDEKTSSFKKQISSFKKFQEEIALDVEKLNERLIKIENSLNEIQSAILGKVGEYGQDIKNIAKEMHSTQNSFSKILNPLTDNIRELQKITGKEIISKPQPKTKSKKSSDFENYLR